MSATKRKRINWELRSLKRRKSDRVVRSYLSLVQEIKALRKLMAAKGYVP